MAKVLARISVAQVALAPKVAVVHIAIVVHSLVSHLVQPQQPLELLLVGGLQRIEGAAGVLLALMVVMARVR